jgi:hypothetical protein
MIYALNRQYSIPACPGWFKDFFPGKKSLIAET